ncbi:MAG: hypothetical protein HFJ53_03890 [Clostridia bacterium]|nr:hypothetical protein [Clostridia bacterium]
MVKEELVKLLRSYNENKSKLFIRKREKCTLEEALKDNIIEIKITKNHELNRNKKVKTNISDNVMATLINEKNKREEIQERIKNIENEILLLKDKTEEVDIRLRGLKYKEREIIKAYYIEGRSYEDIGNRVYFSLFEQTRSADTIKKTISKAMDKIQKL